MSRGAQSHPSDCLCYQCWFLKLTGRHYVFGVAPPMFRMINRRTATLSGASKEYKEKHKVGSRPDIEANQFRVAWIEGTAEIQARTPS